MTSRLRVRHVCAIVCLTGTWHAAALGQGAVLTPEAIPAESRQIIRQALEAASQRAQDTDVQQQNFARELQRSADQLQRRTTRSSPPSDPLSGPVVTDAPFSADALTTVTQTLGDGTRLEQSTSARFYRDTAGRVRREQTIIGLGALAPAGDTQTITIDPDPGDAFAYTLDPVNRTARRVGRSAWTPTLAWETGQGAGNRGVAIRMNDGKQAYFLSGPAAAPLPAGASPSREESLGTRLVEGVKATGHRTTTTIPTGAIGNDRPIEIADERWESPELKMLVYSRYSDPRTGVVEYRLMNINRSEPPPDLFVIPNDYTVPEPVGARGGRSTAPVPLPGQRGSGGRGGRSPQ